jgi:hypothetical protein
MNSLNKLKKLVFNGLLLEDSLTNLKKVGITIAPLNKMPPVITIEEGDYSPKIRYEARRMSAVYEVFYCLENAVRELIQQRLIERKGVDWWTTSVPQKIRVSVEKLKEKERKNKYSSPRSSVFIGYTLFGNLSQIIISNWDEFSDLFPDQPWISSRFNDLEISRNIIMHTGLLPDIEIDRIESIARDWLKQVG